MIWASAECMVSYFLFLQESQHFVQEKNSTLNFIHFPKYLKISCFPKLYLSLRITPATANGSVTSHSAI